MCILKKDIFHIITLFIFLFSLSSALFGQSNPEYSGPYKLGMYAGKADYHYDLIDGDTLLNGPFSMQSYNSSESLSEEEQYFSLKGAFHYNRPNSKWQFRFGTFSREKETELVDLQLKVNLSGVQHIADVNFEKGRPQGKWQHLVQKIDSSSVEKNIFGSYVEFQNGIPRGSLKIGNDSLKLLGRFLRDGYAHDIWELNFEDQPEKMERWYFVSGRLEKILIGSDRDTFELKMYQNEIENEKTIDLDKRYLAILSLQNAFDSTAYKQMGGRISELIEANGYYYQRVIQTLESFTQLAPPTTMPKFRVKVAYYPLEENELAQLDQIKKQYAKMNANAQLLLNDTKLNMLKHSEANIMFLLSVLEEITEQFVSPVKSVLTYEEKGILDFFPRVQLTQPSKADSQTFPEIQVQYEGSSGPVSQTFIGPKADSLVLDQTGFDYLSSLSSYALGCVDSIERILNKNLRTDKLRQEYQQLEKTLLSKEEQLIYIIDSLKGDLPNLYHPALESLEATANENIRQYSLQENYNATPEQALELINCIEGLNKLAIMLSKLPKKKTEIQELYTEEVWNPFTATIMSGQVKERITEAYEDLLIPSLLNNINTELTCGNTEKFQSTLEALHERMQQLRKQNTSKLERKLKKEDDPNMVLQLFEIPI